MNRFNFILNTKQQEVSAKEVDFLIYGAIAQDYWTDTDNSAKTIVAELMDLSKQYDRINIKIHSLGGSIFEGSAISTFIQNSTKEIHTYNDGFCFSMAAVILLSAKKGRVHASRNSMILLHSASYGYVEGFASDLRQYADELDAYTESIITIVEHRTGMDRKEIKKRWFDDKDHLINVEQALELGLIDEIVGQEAKDSQNLTVGESDVVNYAELVKEFTKAMPSAKSKSLFNWFSRFFQTKNESNYSHKNQSIMNHRPLNFTKFLLLFAMVASNYLEDDDGKNLLINQEQADAINKKLQELNDSQSKISSLEQELRDAQLKLKDKDLQVEQLTVENSKLTTELEERKSQNVVTPPVTQTVVNDKTPEGLDYSAVWSPETKSNLLKAGIRV